MAKRRAESELEQVEAEAEAEAEAEKNGRRAAGSQDGVNRALILECSKHSDGSIYSGDDFLAQVLQGRRYPRDRIPEKIQLFDGFISKPCDLNRFVVAVVVNTPLILIFKIDKRDGSDHVPGCCAFKARTHGYEYDMQELKLGCTNILVKLSWSTLE
uniref:DUF6598 domain-containing protein n=1 Tax=Oryza barthii TaxID=65489 RepID=A0A0D3HHR2_9ORYZ